MNNSYTVEDAKRKLEHYCAYQERCHKDVYTKLLRMKIIPEAIDVIIVHLIDNNFLNEERFAKAFVSGKFNIKKWGKRRLELELKRRDISSYNINQALRTITDEDYYNAIDQLARKRCNALKETDTFKKKKKLVDYLLYRGWETHLVYDKVNELIP